MYLDLFEGKTLNAIEGYMDRLSQRQKIVSSNLANIDTPGFKTRDITFHATIDELIAKEPSGGKLRMTRERHIEGENLNSLASIVTEPEGLIERADRNNVDIDWEMMKMSETSIGYSMMTQMLRGKYQKLANSINEGGR
jgi:flagellar basal-body rod protein FlgB